MLAVGRRHVPSGESDNPPTNTLWCHDDYVTRGQMAAFLHRLASWAVDADTADGMGAAAFAAASHNHDGAYLEHGEIVTAASGSNWRPHGGGADPIAGSFRSHVFVVREGSIELGFDAPVMVGTTDYQLKSVGVCYELMDGAYIDLTTVMTASIGVNQHSIAIDNSDCPVSGCHTLDVSEPAPTGAAVRLRVADGDGGGDPLNVYGVQAIWKPCPSSATNSNRNT